MENLYLFLNCPFQNDFKQYTDAQVESFNLISIVGSLDSIVLLLIAILELVCSHKMCSNCVFSTNKLTCHQYFIFWSLVFPLFGSFGRFPRWPYCNTSIWFIYQTMTENIAYYATFLTSILLTYMLHCTTDSKTFGKVYNTIDYNRRKILCTIIILSIFASMVMCSFYILDSNENKHRKNIKMYTMFYSILILACICIVLFAIRVCFQLRNVYDKNLNSLRRSLIVNILGYPILLAGCFLLGFSKKRYDRYTEFKHELLLWQVLYLILHTHYGAFIALLYLFKRWQQNGDCRYICMYKYCNDDNYNVRIVNIPDDQYSKPDPTNTFVSFESRTRTNTYTNTRRCGINSNTTESISFTTYRSIQLPTIETSPIGKGESFLL